VNPAGAAKVYATLKPRIEDAQRDLERPISIARWSGRLSCC